ncbi:IS3 family transposase [Ruminococcaceae bacterium OttesenSCG-928-A16]|nr:IS3 family transposase [Ruminococcaceae bacterium OttesenSCG-928-A16]
MGRQNYTAEQIIVKLREVEVLCGQGKTIGEAVRQIGVSEQTYYRWRKKYGGMNICEARRHRELEKENARLKKLVADLSLDNAILKDIAPGKLLSPAKRRLAVRQAQEKYRLSQRRACRAVQISQRVARYQPVKRVDEDDLRSRIIELACNYGRYGYRRITALLYAEGWRVNHKRVERIWREEGLKVPQKQPKRRRLWLNDGSCIRLRPEHKNHVWSYDFVEDKLSNKRKVRWLNIIDEYSRECLASIPRRSWKHQDIIETLSGLFITKGCPAYIRSDNGSEFTAIVLRDWLRELNIGTAYIEPGSPWENGYCESFNARMRDEFLNGEILDTLTEAEILTRRWVNTYNTVRPHSSLGYRPPAPQAVLKSA